MPEDTKTPSVPPVKTPVVQVPIEYAARNKSIRITKDQDTITIEFAPAIAEEIGAYRRCPVKVIFQEGNAVQVIPVLPN